MQSRSRDDLIWTFISFSPRFRTQPSNSDSIKYHNPLLATVAKLRKSSRSDFPRRTRRPILTTAGGAAGCDLPLARQPPDTGKSALTSFRGEPISPTTPPRGGFRMTRYQFFYNSYESPVCPFLSILIPVNLRRVTLIIVKCSLRIDINAITNKNWSI